VGVTPSASGQREALLAGTAVLQGTTSRLEDAQRVALAAESTGADVLAALAQQRGHLQRIRAQQEETREEVDASTAILNRMNRWYNRFLGV
jgi:vesicle transport through interaction with t-SNAREs 1